MTAPFYCYENCTLVRVIDGDTFIAAIDVGFGFTTTQRIRLMGCDMPERNQPGGKEATLRLKNFLELGQRFTIETIKADSFGRWLAYVTNAGVSASVHMADWLTDWHARQAAAQPAPAQPADPGPVQQQAP